MAVTVVKHVTPPDLVSYTWKDYTEQDLEACMAAQDQAEWIARNATVVNTVTV